MAVHRELQLANEKHHFPRNPFGKFDGSNVHTFGDWFELWTFSLRFHFADEDDEQLLTVSQDGYVMKYAYKKGCDLIARRQMRVELMDGDVEGIPVHKYPRGKQMIPANK